MNNAATNEAYRSASVMRETYQGVTATHIADEMFDRREVAVVGTIDQAMAFDVAQHVRWLAHEDPEAPITVFVDSPGGSVSAGLAIYDALRAVTCPVTTVAVDTAASMGALVFLAGDERVMWPHATLMVHEPYGMGGTTTTIGFAKATYQSLAKTSETLNQLIAERTGLELGRVEELTSRETFLDAQEAVELGFAHRVGAMPKAA